ncbi:hypothetical protein DD238_008026 [Peronospora effusa]|uniref:Uncharacterized protein n=1 Tax=Peronospora effusa TaxID=542832 RepID=A0A3M6V7U6_9STRA|nr:hypothetical protein DD238_008026 [Peronospora effusa]RQM11409.1 hypothetical protein DD237_008113 [Peronospora effusa]
MLRDSFHKHTDFQRCQPAGVDRRAETQREAPESERSVSDSFGREIQEVDRRVTLVDHDASQARELAEALGVSRRRLLLQLLGSLSDLSS